MQEKRHWLLGLARCAPWLRNPTANTADFSRPPEIPARLLLRSRVPHGTQGPHPRESGVSENNRRAKFYMLNTSGRRQLKAEAYKRTLMTDVVGCVLNTTLETL